MRPSVVHVVALALVAASPAAAEDAKDKPVFRERGEASYYSEELEGEPTATGEAYDPDALTAAHPELPLGSEATVTNTETGKEVTVEINDRGPFTEERKIDLSEEAAEQLDMKKDGTAEVEITATPVQVEKAIEEPADEPEVKEAVEEAREAAEADGTPQPPTPVTVIGQ